MKYRCLIVYDQQHREFDMSSSLKQGGTENRCQPAERQYVLRKVISSQIHWCLKTWIPIKLYRFNREHYDQH